MDQLKSFQYKEKKGVTCFVLYDITGNKLRGWISKYLERKGLFRLQKSVFLGRVTPHNYQELIQYFNNKVCWMDEHDAVLILPVPTNIPRKVIGFGAHQPLDHWVQEQRALIF